MVLVSAGQADKMEYPLPRTGSVVDCEGGDVSGFRLSEYPKREKMTPQDLCPEHQKDFNTLRQLCLTR